MEELRRTAANTSGMPAAILGSRFEAIQAHRAFSSASIESASPLTRISSFQHFPAGSPVRKRNNGGLVDRLRHAASSFHGLRTSAVALLSPFASHKGGFRYAVKLRRGSQVDSSKLERDSPSSAPIPPPPGIYLVLADAGALQMEIWKVFPMVPKGALRSEDEVPPASTEGEACSEITRLVARHGQPESLCPILEVSDATSSNKSPLAIRMPYFLGGNLSEWLQSAAKTLLSGDAARALRAQDLPKVGEFSISESAAVQLIKQVLVALTFLHNPDDAHVCLRHLSLKNIFVEQLRADGLPADSIEYYTLVCKAQSVCRGAEWQPRLDVSAPIVTFDYSPHLRLHIPYLRLRIGHFRMTREPVQTTLGWALAPEIRAVHHVGSPYSISCTRDSSEMWNTGLVLTQLLGRWFHGDLEGLCAELGSSSVVASDAIAHRLPVHIESKCIIELISDMLHPNPTKRPTSVDALTRLASFEASSVAWDASFFSRYQFVSGMEKRSVASGISFFPWNSNAYSYMGAGTHANHQSTVGKIRVDDRFYVEEPVNPAERFRRLMMNLPLVPERRMLRVYTIFDMPSTVQGLQRAALSHMLRISQKLGEEKVKYAVSAEERFDEVLTEGAGNISYTTTTNEPISLAGWLGTLRQPEDARLLSNPTVGEGMVRYIALHASYLCDKIWRLCHSEVNGHGSIMPHTLLLQHEPHKFLSIMAKQAKSVEATLPWYETSQFTFDIPLQELEDNTQPIVRTHDFGYYYVHSALASYKQSDHWSVDTWLHDACLVYMSPTRLCVIVGPSKFAELSGGEPDNCIQHCLAADFLVADMMRSKEISASAWTARVTQLVADANEFGALAFTEVFHNLFIRCSEADTNSKPTRVQVVEIINAVCACVITRSTSFSFTWRDSLEVKSPRHESATILHSPAANLCVEFFRQHSQHLLPVDMLARTHDTEAKTIFQLLHERCSAIGDSISQDLVHQFYASIGRCHPDVARVFQALRPWERRHSTHELKSAVESLLEYSCADELLFCMICSDALGAIERNFRNSIASSMDEDSSAFWLSNPLSQIAAFMTEILSRFIHVAELPSEPVSADTTAPMATTSLVSSNPDVSLVWTPHQYSHTEFSASLTRLDAVSSLLKQHHFEDAASYVSEACTNFFARLSVGAAPLTSVCTLDGCTFSGQSLQFCQWHLDLLAAASRSHSDPSEEVGGALTTSRLQSSILQHMQSAFFKDNMQLSISPAPADEDRDIEHLIRRIMGSTSTNDDRYALGMSIATLLLGPRVVEGPPGSGVVSEFVRAVWNGALKSNPTDYLPESRVSEGARNVIVKLLYENYGAWTSALSDIRDKWVVEVGGHKRRLIFDNTSTVDTISNHGLHVIRTPGSLVRIPKNSEYGFVDLCSAALHRLYHPEELHAHSWKFESDLQLLVWQVMRIASVFDEITLQHPDEASILLTRLLRMHGFGGVSARGFTQRIFVVLVGFGSLQEKSGFTHTNGLDHLHELGFDRNIAKADFSATLAT